MSVASGPPTTPLLIVTAVPYPWGRRTGKMRRPSRKRGSKPAGWREAGTEPAQGCGWIFEHEGQRKGAQGVPERVAAPRTCYNYEQVSAAMGRRTADHQVAFAALGRWSARAPPRCAGGTTPRQTSPLHGIAEDEAQAAPPASPRCTTREHRLARATPTAASSTTSLADLAAPQHPPHQNQCPTARPALRARAKDRSAGATAACRWTRAATSLPTMPRRTGYWSNGVRVCALAEAADPPSLARPSWRARPASTSRRRASRWNAVAMRSSRSRSGQRPQTSTRCWRPRTAHSACWRSASTFTFLHLGPAQVRELVTSGA